MQSMSNTGTSTELELFSCTGICFSRLALGDCGLCAWTWVAFSLFKTVDSAGVRVGNKVLTWLRDRLEKEGVRMSASVFFV